MNAYIRKVQYHETDKMGIVQHSNYVKWMEEARIDFLEQMGFGYAKLEEDGIISPVTKLECDYKYPARFGDTVQIKVKIKEFKGVRLILSYIMTIEGTESVTFQAESQHCFTSADGRPLILKKQFPDFDKAIREYVNVD